MSKRLYYVDWLRVGAVLLLFPFHTWRVFNAGDPFYVKSPYASGAINYVIGFLDVWHMPLLFALAGASTYFALRKRSGLQYAGERVMRLGVPWLFGFLALIPPQTWYGAQFNRGLGYGESFWSYMANGRFLVWNLQGGGDYYGGFGMGQLWFIFYLFFIALFSLPLLLWWRSEGGQKHAARFSRALSHPAFGWLLAAVVILIGEVLPSPIEDKRFFMDMGLFILGYATMADETFMERAERYRWPLLTLGLTATLFSSLTGDFRDSFPDPSLPLLGLALVLFGGIWLVIAGLLGMGRRHLDRPSRALSYLGEASYPLYILHQTVIVMVAYYLIGMPGPWAVQWLALLAIVVAVTFGLYEVVRRVGVLRFLFGMRPSRREA